MMNQQQQQQQPLPPLMNLNNHNLMNMNQSQQQMLPARVGYGMWPPPAHFRSSKPIPGVVPGFEKPLGPRSNWKGKKAAGSSNVNDKRRIEQQNVAALVGSGGKMMGVGGLGNSSSFTNYQPPNLNELQHRNRLKTRKFFPKKRFNKSGGVNMDKGNHNDFYDNSSGRSAPYAPRNTTSFIIRAKKSGGIASLVSPSPGTPAILPSPFFSPSREVLVDMAKEEWGVDGYGSMKGLIRLRSPGDENEEDEGGSSELDVEEHVELERRLDHDLSRFEMIYNPNRNNLPSMEYHTVLENRVDDQDNHIAHLEEENLILKERLFLMESELGNLRRRMQFLERKQNRGEEMNEEVMENESDNESESREEVHRHEELSDEKKVLLDASTSGHETDNFDAVTFTEKNGVPDAGESSNLGPLDSRGTSNEIELVGADNTTGLSTCDVSDNLEGGDENKFDLPVQDVVMENSTE